jgi:hypothetical protein
MTVDEQWDEVVEPGTRDDIARDAGNQQGHPLVRDVRELAMEFTLDPGDASAAAGSSTWPARPTRPAPG